MSQAAVKDWFDQIAGTYRARVDGDRPWHTAVFNRRMDLAISAAPVAGKRVLDIGAGTGALYDYLLERGIETDYYACDISGAMLAQSHIPADRQSVGDTKDLSWPVKFDTVYLLGLTTYLSAPAWQQLLADIDNRLLANGGTIVVHFTHKNGLDNRLRSFYSPVLKLIGRGTVGQSFKIWATDPLEVSHLVGARWRISPPQYFGFALTPLQHIFPQFMAKRNQKQAVSKFWATDFLVMMGRRL
jgi:SAM-dependent methyltransferase